MTGCIYTWGPTEDDFSGQIFLIFEIIIFCFVVAICDLVHAVEAIYYLNCWQHPEIFSEI